MDEMNRMEPMSAEANAEETPRYSEAVVRRAPLMAKWLWVMFWVNIASNIIGLFEFAPSLAKFVGVGTLMAALVVCMIYFLFRKEDKRYQTGAILGLITVVLNGLETLVLAPNGADGWVTFLNIIAAIVGLLMTYNLYYAHHQIVGEADRQVGERWLKLWKWKIYAVAALIGSIVVALIIPVLGVLVALAAAVFALVVSVYELVILYRSAKAYRAVAEGEGNAV